jgi:hypothetical protein
MTTTRQHKDMKAMAEGFLPMPAGVDSGSKWLIAAVLAAGKDGCGCDSCKLLKRFGGAMSEAMLKEEAGSGD